MGLYTPVGIYFVFVVFTILLLSASGLARFSTPRSFLVFCMMVSISMAIGGCVVFVPFTQGLSLYYLPISLAAAVVTGPFCYFVLPRTYTPRPSVQEVAVRSKRNEKILLSLVVAAVLLWLFVGLANDPRVVQKYCEIFESDRDCSK